MSNPDQGTPIYEPGAAIPEPRERRSVPARWIVLVIAGAIIALLSLGPLFGGGFLLWVDATQKDSNDFYSTPSERLETTSYAITSDEIDLGADPTGDETVVDFGDFVTLRIDVDGTGETPAFVGIGAQDDVDAYLEGVKRAIVTDVGFDPFSVDYRYEGSDAPSGRPGDQDFWAASEEGTGEQQLEWEPSSGNWAVVIMNADASEGVSVNTALAAKSPWVFRVGLGLTIGGAIGAILGSVLLVVGVVGMATRSELHLAGPAVLGAPVTLQARLDSPSRWLWLLKWLLLIPHLIVLAVLWVAFSVVTFIAFFAILFTARYPRALFEFNVGVLRWTWRVTYYGYSALGTDQYPPFTLGSAPDYPATFEVEYPERLSRGLVLIKWWLLAIPHYIVLGIIGGAVGGAFGDDWGAGYYPGLLGVLVFFVALVLLFVGNYPQGMFDLVVGLNRWVFRVVAYVTLLRDEYPPFRLDQGGAEPAGAAPATSSDRMGDDDAPGSPAQSGT